MRRILAMLLAIVLLVGNVPVQVFANDGSGDMPCATVGCEYLLGHEGNCSNYVEPCSNANCTYEAGHEGNCSDYVEPCDNTNCTYAAGHEGNCSDFIACETNGCEYAAGHEGNCSNFVACETEGCEFAAGHEGNCSNYVEPTADELAAQSVIDLIAAIGQITLESEAAIGAADTAYAALTDAQKLLVTNAETLEAAKSAYAQLSAVPAPVEDSVTIETGDVAEYPVDAYLGKIVLKGVNGTVSGSGQNWEVEMAEGTDPTQPITFELTSAVTVKPNRYFWVNGECLETPLIDSDPGSVTFVPDWYNGRATVTACVGTASKASGTQYTIELSIKGLAKEEFNTVRLDEGKSKKYFVQKVFLSGIDATAFSVSDTDFSGSTSGHKATIEYALDQMPTAPVQLTFTMATSGSFFIACNGADRVEANGTYTAEVDLKEGTAYTDDYRIERSGFGGGTTTNTAQDVIRLIKQIGTVTLAREDAIRKAREAYDSLPDAQKAQVYNYDVLVAAEKRLGELKIQDAINLINAIGTVTLSSGSKIDDAWNAYNALTVEQKAKVTNFSKLVKAQDTYNDLRAEETEKLIDEIDETVTLDSEKAILAARKSYNALTETQKKLVDKEHLDKLKAAELALANLKATDNDKKKAEEVMEQIDKLGTVTLDSEEAIKAARKAYDKLTDLQKALVTNYEILEAAEKKLEELKRLKTLEEIYYSTGDYLENLGIPSVGSVGGEWMVIGLARSGRTVPGADTYYDRVVQFVRENADENQRLHFAKSTENSRVILALTALGKDVTNVDGHNLLLGLNDLSYLQKQGINGPIWALIALDSGNYPVPEGNVTREILLETILAAQLGDGGWALSGIYADPDMTGMALQALAPYYKENAKVKTAVDQALAALSLMQSADGSYSGIDGTSSESIVQVITALAALEIDADTDPRFTKNGFSVLDALLTYYVPGGGFRHIPEGNLDGMATEQGYYALTSYYRMLKNQTALYDMTDIIDLGGDAAPAETTASVEIARETEDKDSGNSAVVWISVTAICSMAAAAVILGRKKLFKF